MSTSFNAILDLSRFDARALAPVLECTDVGHLIERVAEEFAPQARQKGLEIRLRKGNEPSFALSDEVLLGRVVRNLVSNAVKFTDTGGVLIGVVAHTNRLRIGVYDTGMGIPPKYHDAIFTEFFQIASARERQQGAGLGLSIVRKSVDLLAGHALDFASREGRGSRFCLSLPRAAGNGVRFTESSPAYSPARNVRLEGSYIAVVDDEPLVLQGVVALLRNWGCLVVAGHSGPEIVAAVAQNERIPDLLIADWRLGNGESGLDVAANLNREAGRNVPILLMTGDPLRELPGDTSGVKLVHKPIDAEQLRVLLDELLPERQFI